MTNAIIFTRVSTREQEEGYSLEAQYQRLKEYCERKNFTILKHFQIIESSTRGDRQKFYEMIDFVKKQKGEIAIVCDKVDRLQRSFKELPVLDELRRNGKIELHFYVENQVLSKNSNASQIMMYQFLIMQAEAYTNAISDNVKRSNQQMLREGKYGYKAPLGYLNSRDKNNKPTVIPDPDMAPIVVKLFEDATGALNIPQLLAEARELGLKSLHGNNLTKQTIINMLRNPFYYGYMKIKGKLWPHNHQQLISKETADRCKAVLSGKQFHRIRKEKHLFQGLVHCPHCGRQVVIDMKRKKSGKVYKYLVCQHCKHSVSEKVAEESLLEIMTKFSKIPTEIFNSIVSYLNEKITSDHKIETARRGVLAREISVAKTRKDRLLNLYLDGKIDNQTFEMKRIDLEAELAKKEAELSNLKANSEKAVFSIKLLLNMIKNAKILYKSSSFEEKRMILKTLYSNFFLDDKNLTFSIRKPLSSILDKGFRPDWLWVVDNLRTHYTEIEELKSRAETVLALIRSAA